MRGEEVLVKFSRLALLRLSSVCGKETKPPEVNGKKMPTARCVQYALILHSKIHESGSKVPPRPVRPRAFIL
jgi:hypothetical protein